MKYSLVFLLLICQALFAGPTKSKKVNLESLGKVDTQKIELEKKDVDLPKKKKVFTFSGDCKLDGKTFRSNDSGYESCIEKMAKEAKSGTLKWDPNVGD